MADVSGSIVPVMIYKFASSLVQTNTNDLNPVSLILKAALQSVRVTLWVMKTHHYTNLFLLMMMQNHTKSGCILANVQLNTRY